MYSRDSFGSYYPVDSCIHRLNPVIKVINFLIIIILTILSLSTYINIFMLLLVIIMMLLSFVPFKYYLRTFYALRYVYVLIALLCYYFNTSLELCLVYISKVIVVVEYLNIIAYTTSPSENIYGIEKFLSLFNFLYLPVSKVAFKINSILRYFPLYLTVKYKTLKASTSRGIDYNNLNMFKRFTSSFKLRRNIRRLTKYKNDEINTCSELRLYDIGKYRTNYRTNKVGFYDIFFLLFHVVLMYAYLVEGGLLWDI